MNDNDYCKGCRAPLDVNWWNEEYQAFICDCGQEVDLPVEIDDIQTVSSSPCCEEAALNLDTFPSLRFNGEVWVCEECFNRSFPNWRNNGDTTAATLICEMHRR